MPFANKALCTNTLTHKSVFGVRIGTLLTFLCACIQKVSLLKRKSEEKREMGITPERNSASKSVRQIVPLY